MLRKDKWCHSWGSQRGVTNIHTGDSGSMVVFHIFYLWLMKLKYMSPSQMLGQAIPWQKTGAMGMTSSLKTWSPPWRLPSELSGNGTSPQLHTFLATDFMPMAHSWSSALGPWEGDRGLFLVTISWVPWLLHPLWRTLPWIQWFFLRQLTTWQRIHPGHIFLALTSIYYEGCQGGRYKDVVPSLNIHPSHSV